MSRHPLHIQNGNSEQDIALAKLMLAIDAVDTNEVLRNGESERGPHEDLAAVPMEQWSEIVEARKSLERHVRRQEGQHVEALLFAVDSINLTKAFDTRKRAVRVPVSTWIDILVQRDELRGPQPTKAYATEYYIRHGRFPGQ